MKKQRFDFIHFSFIFQKTYDAEKDQLLKQLDIKKENFAKELNEAKIAFDNHHTKYCNSVKEKYTFTPKQETQPASEPSKQEIKHEENTQG